MVQPAPGPGLPGAVHRRHRGQGARRAGGQPPVYVVIGVTVNGERDILGLRAGDGSECAKFWLSVLTELKNPGVADVCIVVCDGLKGLAESITTTWPLAQARRRRARRRWCAARLGGATERPAGRQPDRRRPAPART